MSKEIDDALGMSPIEEIVDESTEIEVYESSSNKIETFSTFNVDEDIELVKDNIRTIMDKGSDVLDEVINLAKQADSARAYEVVSTTIKALLDVNKDYLEAVDKQKKYKEEKGEGENKPTSDVTNNILVMSTNEVLEKILAAQGKTVEAPPDEE